MQVAVTCITGNQSVIEACQRILPAVDRLNESISREGVVSSYSHLLVSFVDKSDDFMRFLPNRDAIIQAQIGYVAEGLDRGVPQLQLLDYVSSKLNTVVRRAKLEEEVREQLTRLLEKWVSSEQRSK